MLCTDVYRRVILIDVFLSVRHENQINKKQRKRKRKTGRVEDMKAGQLRKKAECKRTKIQQ